MNPEQIGVPNPSQQLEAQQNIVQTPVANPKPKNPFRLIFIITLAIAVPGILFDLLILLMGEAGGYFALAFYPIIILTFIAAPLALVFGLLAVAKSTRMSQRKKLVVLCSVLVVPLLAMFIYAYS